VARLKPGVTMAQADQDVVTTAGALRDGFKEFGDDKLGLHVAPLHGDAVREIRPPLLALFAGVGFVLLIACVNVANLLLARAGVRQKEMALRAALGASRARIFRQLLIESLVLALLGGGAGLVLGSFAVGRLAALAPAGLLPAAPVSLDFGILAFAASITLAAGLLFGLWPALDGCRVDLVEALQQVGRGSATALRRRARSLLIVAEVALGFILLVGAGLLIRTFVEIQRVDPGFRAERLLTFEMGIPGNRYPNDEAGSNLVRRVEEALRALPGVEAVGGVSHLPLDDYANWYSGAAPKGSTEEQRHGLMADHRSTTPGYFRAVGATLVAGRLFDEMDERAKRPVVVIDEKLAKEAWPGEEAVGRTLEFEKITEGEFHPGSAEVIGVIRHIQHHALTRQVRGQIYIPFSQSARWHISFVVRAAGDPAALAGAVRRAVAGIDRQQAVAKLRPMTFYMDRAMAAARFTMVLASIFSALALVLAAIGLYGVVAYSVGQRVREFGIRLALGARAGEIQRQVVREGMTLALAGLGIGALGAVVLSRLLAAILFGVGPGDVITYAAAAALMPMVAAVACWLPARRVSALSPLAVLRAE
jgi:predicted permease